MPLYEYRCTDCNQKFDALVQHRDDADGVACQSCASPNVRRLVSSFAMVGGFDDPIAAEDYTASSGGCCGGSCGCCGN